MGNKWGLNLNNNLKKFIYRYFSSFFNMGLISKFCVNHVNYMGCQFKDGKFKPLIFTEIGVGPMVHCHWKKS